MTDAKTDSTFYYTFLGTAGNSEEYKADEYGNDRERGKVDVWKFTDENYIGEFRCIMIRMVGDDAWYFDKVRICKNS